MKKKLVLSPKTFLWKEGDDILFYGSHNQNYIKITNAPQDVKALCSALQSNQLYYAIIDMDSLSNSLEKIIEQIEEKSLGRLVDEHHNLISIKPVLSIQDNIELIRRDKSFNYRLLDYLHSLEFYIGGKCSRKCYGEQIVFPINSNEKLTAHDLEIFLAKCSASALSKVDIIISDYDISFVDSLANVFDGWREVITVHSVFENKTCYFKLLKKIGSQGVKQRIIVDAGNVSNVVEFCNNLIAYDIPLLVVDFIVKTEGEVISVKQAETILEGVGVNINVTPVYFNNEEFIARNIQLTEREILESKLTKRAIYIHQSININNWGKLSIRPDNSVSVDPFSREIGKTSDSIYEIILAALSEDMWLKTRSSCECRNCLYRWLCPSPTRIENVVPNHKICNFKP